MKSLVVFGFLFGGLLLPELANARIETVECQVTRRAGPWFASHAAKKCAKSKCTHAGGEITSKSIEVSRWYVSRSGWRSNARLSCHILGGSDEGIESFGEDTEE